jgi:phosphopantetheinyl transferase (holo-ACP synthase)
MEEDTRSEVMRVVGDVSMYYTCPNNHVYGIGNCGKPMQRAACPQCGSAIGGESHSLVSGNRVAGTIGDTTQTGYVISPVLPVRDLNLCEVYIIRFIIHSLCAVRVWTDEQNATQAFANFSASGQQCAVQVYFLNAANEDLRMLAKGLSLSEDETMIAICIVLSRILQSVQAYSRRLNHMLNNENGNTNSGLMIRLFETDIDPDVEPPVPKLLWRFRNSISYEHFVQQLQRQKKDEYPILELFAEQEALLKAVRHLPKIIAFQRMLVNRVSGQIDLGALKTLDSKSLSPTFLHCTSEMCCKTRCMHS